MEYLRYSKKEASLDGLLGTTPKESEIGDVIATDAMIDLGEGNKLLYIKIPREKTEGFREIAKKVKPNKSTRVNGIPTQSIVFGALPRSAIRADYCRYSRATHDNRDSFGYTVAFGQYLSEIYRKYFPDEHGRNLSEIQSSVHADWNYSGTPFLTCNLNMNHAIRYHRDRGNYSGHLSNVLVIKDGMSGGGLVLPEYGFTLNQQDDYLSIFDGQSVIHGVLPITKTKTNGYRISVVYYSLAGMRNCLCKTDEYGRLCEQRKKKESRSTQEVRDLVRKINKGLLVEENRDH